MKNFSTAAVFLTLAASVLPVASHAQTPAAAVKKTSCTFLANAPDQHVVVKGDTLWDISGKFLQHPWCWPQVWDMNREQIHNPHWIYPGQVVYFDRVAGRLRLGKPGSNTGSMPTVRLSPGVRSSALDSDAIPAIPQSIIEPFLSRPLIVEAEGLKDAPRIVATQENHVYLSNGDKAYVRGNLTGHDMFQVFRPGKPLKDPATKEVIGYEAVHLGTLKLVQEGKTDKDPSTLVVVNSKQEMGVGDRLLPQEPTPIINYVPHASEKPIDARIVAVYGGVTQAGQNAVVSINRGARDGIDVGTVLELYRLGQTIKDPTSEKGKEVIKLPDEKYGTLFVFRVFNRVSYGLIMEVQDSAQVGDIAASPE